MTGNSKLVLMGDFNYPDIDWEHNCVNNQSSISNKFLNCIHKNYLYQHITQPTHYRCEQNPTVIDLIVTNEPNLIRDLKYFPPFGKSHHVALYFVLDVNINYSMKSTSKYLYNKGDYDKLRKHFADRDWNDVSVKNLGFNAYRKKCPGFFFH